MKNFTRKTLPEAIPLPPSLLAIQDVDLLILKIECEAQLKESYPSELYTPSELNEIAEMTTDHRRMEKTAGKMAVKLLACNILKRWFKTEGDLSAIEVRSLTGPVSVRAPTAPLLDALLKPLFFSLSHTDGFVLAAVGRKPIGVDVEKIRPLSAEMTREIGGETLIKVMEVPTSSANASMQPLLPLIVFTQKEAILKAAGVGLESDLASVELSSFLLNTPIDATYCGLRYQAISAVEHDCIFSVACGIPCSAEQSVVASPNRRNVIPNATQEIMWLMGQVEGMGTTHNVCRAIRLRGPLNVEALAKSVQFITNRHEALRTVFRDVDGKCEADILESMTVSLPVEILGDDSSESVLNMAKSRCHEEVIRRFDLARPPLVRSILFVLGREDYLLLMVFHHTIIDATAFIAWRQELAVCYPEFAGGRTPVLPPIALTFYDYTQVQRERLTPERTNELLDYWRATLKGAPGYLTLPTDHPRPVFPTFDSDNVEVTIPAHLVESLRTLRAAEGVSMFVIFLTAFQVFLSRLSRQNDLVIGIPFVDRRTPSTLRLIGCLVNMLPLRVNHLEVARFRELLPRVQTVLNEALEHHELPFPALVEKLASRNSTSCPPVFQASILLMREETRGVNLEGLNQELYELPAGGTACDLSLYLTIGKTGSQARFEYNRNLFDKSTVCQMADLYLMYLGRIATNPNEPISAFPCLLDKKQQPETSPRNGYGKSCIIMGEGTLPIRCGELLLQRGFSIRCVVTRDIPLSCWARAHKIPVLLSGRDLATRPLQDPFDYLFSIFNVHVLPESVLELPKIMAINYHDALLPRYAGLHATSWALLNRESFHGVTWHQMKGKVDEGNILIQRRVEILPEDTALSLNLKCFDAAFESLGKLMDSLEGRAVTTTRQDLSKRTYFPKEYRPDAACVIPWDRSAEEISALIRALDFGPYHNPLGLPKVAMGPLFFVVNGVRILNETIDAPPGTVVRIDKDLLTVATATKAVELSGLTTVDGEPLMSEECQEHFKVDSRLVILDTERAAKITALNNAIVRAESFWVERLASLQTASLPNTMAFNGKRSEHSHYTHLAWQLPQGVEAWLEKFGKQWRRDEFLIASLGGYLARVTNLDSFDIGYMDSESLLDKDGLEGLFAGVVPLRFVVDVSRNFEELLHLTRKELEQIRRGKTYTRDIIPRNPRLRDRAELRGLLKFPTTMIMNHAPDLLEQVRGDDLSIILPKHGSECGIVFNTAVFDDRSAKKIIKQFSLFINSVAADSHQPISGISILAEDDRKLVLEKWNSTPSICLPKICIHTLFEEQVKKTPTGIALVFDGSELTYQQLNENANRLAHFLVRLGTGPETRVGVCVERSFDMVIGLLAILKAGGAYVPLDPAYPKERLTFMQKDAQPRVILTQKRLATSLPANPLPVIFLDELPDQVPRESSDNLYTAVLPEHPAYIIYTSGSTGQPKGVVIEHRSLVNYSLAANQKFAINMTDRVLQFASINFDASAEEIYPCLISGATLVLRTDEMIKSAESFLDLCQTWKVTLLDLPTTYWSQLVTQIDRGNLQLPPLIRLVIIGGESVLPEKVVLWQKRVSPKVQLFNTYGPTEATIVTTWFDLTDFAIVSHSQGGLPIGKPVPNAQVYVLDTCIQPVPIGIIGELFIGGTGLARGYLNQPKLTDERFIPNPFNSASGMRLYKTGDRVRFLPDGNLEFMGRQDHQVKIRGFRVELNEVEAAISRHPSIREIVVMVREDTPDDKRLVAYIVLMDVNKRPGADDLRSFLKQKLPDYMIPAAYVILEQFPMSPNGKIDRKSLPTPPWDQIGTKEFQMAPRNLTEEILASIWCEVLALKKVSIHDNFFDRGGHSLLGVRLITEIRKAFQCEIALRSLFLAPTIAELAKLLKDETINCGSTIHLMEIQKGRGHSPLFFIPGGGGGENEFMVYARMMRQLRHDSPVYGFRIWGLDGRTQPHCSVESMASTFIQELRSILPRGPYLLVGECLGGILAFEMARQLRAQGEDIAFLGMLDASFPTPKAFLRLFAEKLRPRMKQCWDRIFQIPKPHRLAGIPGAVKITWNELGNDLGYLRSHPLQDEEPTQRQRSIKKVSYTYNRTLLRYRPKSYDGKITMLLTESFTGLSAPPTAWAKIARGGMDIHKVPGDHTNYVRDHAVITGQILGTCIKACIQSKYHDIK